MFAKFINKTKMKKVNTALKTSGYPAYRGDSTTAEPKGCGAGYASNLIDNLGGADPDARKELEKIVRSVIEQ